MIKNFLSKLFYSAGYWIGQGMRSSFSRELKYLENNNNFFPIKIWDLEMRRKSFEFFKNKFSNSLLFDSSKKIRVYTSEKACKNFGEEDFLFLEFGVFNGVSTKQIARQLTKYNKVLYGFDSFNGITEDWIGFTEPEGSFSRKGEIPNFEEQNIKLEVGNIYNTLEKFLSNQKKNICFIHVDTDTYEVAKFILEKTRSKLIKGSIILFDELYNFSGWENGEFKALREIFKENEYKFIAFTNGQQAAIEIL